MTPSSVLADCWLGLCRKAPVARASPICPACLTESACKGQPGCGGRGTETIRRGIGAAVSGMRTLNRNRQLLWFGLLAALVMGGTIIGKGVLSYLNWILSDAIVLRSALGFFLDFATLFCIVFLLAGLVLSISSGKERSSSVFAGLVAAKKYTSALLQWSCILALAGIVLERLFFYPGGLLSMIGLHAIGTLTEYPFTLHLNPSTFAEIPGYGGRSLLFWTYPYGLENALEFSLIALVLFLLTLFVVPLIVLEQNGIRQAVAGSFARMKKIPAEIVTSTVFLSVIVYGVFLTCLLVQAAHGMATPSRLLSARPTDLWFALGILYYLAFSVTVFVTATVGGIASLELFRYAGTKEDTA